MKQWYHIHHFGLYEQWHCFQGSDMIRHMRSGERTRFVQAREKVEYIDSFQKLKNRINNGAALVCSNNGGCFKKV